MGRSRGYEPVFELATLVFPWWHLRARKSWRVAAMFDARAQTVNERLVVSDSSSAPMKRYRKNRLSKKSASDLQQLPFWIQELLTRMWFSCNEPAYVHFRQDMAREQVIEFADAHENGREQLRTACVACLTREDTKMIERALTCLFAIGLASDADAVETLLDHSDEQVRKAARTCLFELRKRPLES